MSLAHLHMTYAAATTNLTNSSNANLLFNSNLQNFHPNQLIQSSAAAAAVAANIQYHNHQNYLNYQHHYHQSQLQQTNQPSNQQHQRSTFAIQELLGLSNDNPHSNRSFLPETSGSKALQISTNFENSISSPNKNDYDLDAKKSDDLTKSDDSKEAAIAAAYGAYFSRNNFIANYSPSKSVHSNSSELVATNKKQKLNAVQANSAESNNSDDLSLDEIENDEESYGKYLSYLISLKN